MPGMILSYPDMTWLNVTNAVLGALTLAAVAAFGWGLWLDIRERAAMRANTRVVRDDHAFVFGELGMTMADGGTPVDKTEKPAPPEEPLYIRGTDELEE